MKFDLRVGPLDSEYLNICGEFLQNSSSHIKFMVLEQIQIFMDRHCYLKYRQGLKVHSRDMDRTST